MKNDQSRTPKRRAKKAGMTPLQRKYMRAIGQFLAASLTGNDVEKYAAAALKAGKAVELEAGRG